MTTAVREVASAAGKVPVVGHGWRFLRDPLGFVTRQNTVSDVVSLRLFGKKAYLVTAPEAMRELLVTQDDRTSQGPLTDVTRETFGDGVITSEGDFHRKQRRLMQPLFVRKRMAGYVDVMVESAADMSASWQDGQRIDMAQRLHELSVTNLVKSVFSRDCGPEVAETAGRAVPLLLRRTVTQALTPNAFFALPTPGNRRFRAAQRDLHELVQRFIASYRSDSSEEKGLLANLMEAQDPETGESMNEQQVHDEVMSMFIAGADTVPSTLSWLFYLLGGHPEIAGQLCAELDEVLGDGPFTFDHLTKLELLGRVTEETLRLYPAGWIGPKRALAEIELDGHRIPAGSDVFYCPYALHRRPELFTEPDRFDPDRWRPERASKMRRDSFLPFSMGSRNCLGTHFARAQIMITAGSLLRHWHFEPVLDARIRPVALGALKPSQLPVHLRRR